MPFPPFFDMTPGGALRANLSFYLDLSDAGNGVVNTTPAYAAGSGTPTKTRTTTAYTRLSSGLWTLVGAGDIRSMYAADGTYLGGWYEGARADVLGTTAAIRRVMTDAGWVSGGGGITVGGAVGMDGVANAAASLTAAGAAGTILFTKVLASAARTYSAWVRRKTGTGTIEITDNGGTNYTDITSTLTTTYQLFQVTRTQANPVVGFRITTDTDAIEVDFNTIEDASFANPTPIPVNVSKAGDVLTYPAIGNTADAVGSAYAEVSGTQTGGQQDIIVSSNGTGGFPLYLNSSNDTLRLYDGTAERSLGTFNLSTTVQKIATSWGGTAANGAIAGALGATSPATFDGSMNMDTTISIGQETGTQSLFGSIRNVRIYSIALPSTTLESITA